MNSSAEVQLTSDTLSSSSITYRHLRGLLEALLFMSDRALKVAELAELARADTKEVRTILEELSAEYREHGRGFLLNELASGFQLQTNPAYAPFVRDLTAQKPVKLTRAQIETLSIIAYRQPITRPEIEDIRGVDAGAVVKVLLERDLVRILGKKDEPGRPLLYGTTSYFLEFFGLKSLRELPTLREFTELTDESRELVERELGEVLPEGPREHAVLISHVEELRTDTTGQNLIITNTEEVLVANDISHLRTEVSDESIKNIESIDSQEDKPSQTES